MARLVVVSNRVAVPDGKAGGRAGGLEVAVKAALKRIGRASGSAGAARSPTAASRSRPRTIDARQHRLRRHRPRRRRLPGILQRLRQPGAVADPALPLRSRRILAPRSVRLLRVNEHFASELAQGAAARRSRLGARLSPDPARQGAARRAATSNRIGYLPAHPVPAAGNAHRAAEPRAADADARATTIWSASRPATTRSISRAISTRECGLHSRDFTFAIGDRDVQVDAFPVGIETEHFARTARRAVEVELRAERASTA